jgi:hypothetical protein
MQVKYNFAKLCDDMKVGRHVAIHHNGVDYPGIIRGIRAEDGSGNCWLVKLVNGAGEREVFVRTE